ncbi:MAG: UDP-N-acetylmuramoyl-L-alanyl-D-glutamate--2,6-diaminopimelate ligase [Acidobacteriota bacterium]
MKLSELIAELPISGFSGDDPEITGIAHDSRRVMAGDLFVAWQGERHDGAAFAPAALAAGAVAVLVPHGNAPSHEAENALWLTAESPHRLLGALAARMWRRPDRDLLMAGVTGTNGKSTVAALLKAMLDAAARPAGIVGTLGYRFQGLMEPAARTTPEPSDLFRLLRRMADLGAESLVMEASSHALALGRLDEVTFDLAVFTNLTRDHFDLHGDLESYFAAKRSLFDRLRSGGWAVTNVDDSFGRRLVDELEEVRKDGRLFSYSSQGAPADVAVLDVDFDATGTRARLTTPAGDLEIGTPLLGRFNLENLTAAIAGALALGLDPRSIARTCAAFAPLPGRLEPVAGGGAVPVFIDFAHTEEALRAAIESLTELTGRKLVVVFGCGGDRDPGKRRTMGRIAGELAELPIVTSDNPRSEDPLAIIKEVEKGLVDSGNHLYRVVPDRREAIRRAVAVARDDQAVLIAGKGHEETQTLGAVEHAFSDREEALEALEERYGEAVGG